jgi:hypothetical protein
MLKVPVTEGLKRGEGTVNVGMKEGWHGDFFPLVEVAGPTMGAAWGRPVGDDVGALLQCRGGRGRPGGPKAGWVGWLLGRLGQKSKEISFCNKNWIFEYSKALEICTRRFRMDFDVGIFF